MTQSHAHLQPPIYGLKHSHVAGLMIWRPAAQRLEVLQYLQIVTPALTPGTQPRVTCRHVLAIIALDRVFPACAVAALDLVQQGWGVGWEVPYNHRCLER